VFVGADPCDTDSTPRAWVCPDLVPPRRSCTDAMKAARQVTELLREPTGAPAAVETVPCVYCREPIAAHTFTYWSSARRLLSADCPGCQRRVTLPTATWRRWSRESGTSAATA